jgi:hypothetical protein
MVDQNVSITWHVAGRVFWTIFWRSILVGILIALPIQVLLFWLLASGRLDDTTHFFLNRAIAFVGLVGGGLVAVRMALQKQYRGFRFQLVRDPDKGAVS